MAKRNYYQHSARQYAKKTYKTNAQINACKDGFEKGFELALQSLKETNFGQCKEEIKTWMDVWENVLTDESEWDL